jgi:hypothetical protein
MENQKIIKVRIVNSSVNKVVNFTLVDWVNQTDYKLINFTAFKSVNQSFSTQVNKTQQSNSTAAYHIDMTAAAAFYTSLFVAQALNAFFLLRAMIGVTEAAEHAFAYLFSEPWNLIILLTQSLVTASLSMFAVGVPNEDLRVMSSVTIVLLWFCLLKYLKYFHAVSFLVELLVAIICEVFPFFIVVGNVMVGFTLAYIVILQRPRDPSQYLHSVSNSSVRDVSYEFIPVIFNIVQISEGRLDFSDMDLTDDHSTVISSFAKVLFIFLTITVTIVCLSALISIMNSTYEQVMENQSALRYHQKMLLCLDEMEAMRCSQLAAFERDVEWVYILSPSADRCGMDKGLDVWDGKFGHRWSGHLQSMKRELDSRMTQMSHKLDEATGRGDRDGFRQLGIGKQKGSWVIGVSREVADRQEHLDTLQAYLGFHTTSPGDGRAAAAKWAAAAAGTAGWAPHAAVK